MDFGLFTRAGERGFTLERMFNHREGFQKEQDCLPKRFTPEPLKGRDEETTVPLDRMRKKYYRIRGWDKNGYPTKKTLRKLGLDTI